MASRSILALCTFCILLGLTAARPAPTTKYVLVFFGDSLTDTGNTLRDGGVPDPSIYYKGRYTNGPNWVDRLSQAVAAKYSTKVFNYAYGGATACPNAAVSSLFPYVMHLPNQTAKFLNDLQFGRTILSGDESARILPIQWIGSNDVQDTMVKQLQGVNFTMADVQAFVKGVVACRLQAAKSLLEAGLPFVVMLPMSPLHIAPAVPSAFKPMVAQLEVALDAALATGIAAVQSVLDALPPGFPGAGGKLHLLGDASWIQAGTTQIKPAFKNMTGSCFSSPVSSMVISPGIKLCAKPDSYLFYDNIHVSQRFHQWFAMKGVLPRLQELGLLPKKL
ncbi:hypothetical protein Agub_g14703 [Astrephomene gubernaculifera]|uniref:GDSL esterase/lipase n=1 Tax=Astrephomene gubernaculifera TaxID=47775 RepID=A0AAD3E1U3_9CHLO|nr:hypothetical protein Agub_g14703 [Astrephomene gubernaculifera]